MISVLQDNFLSEKECVELINLHGKHKQKVFKFRDNFPLLVFSKERLKNTILPKKFINKLQKVSLLLNNSIIDWCEIVYWPTSSFMPLHKDLTKADTTVLTSLIWLNGNFTGGHLFYEDGTTFVPKQGRGLFFDGIYNTHGVTKVESGERYTLIAWYKKK
jgi:hypothetical protein